MITSFIAPRIKVRGKLYQDLEIHVSFTISPEPDSEYCPASDNLEIQQIFCELPGNLTTVEIKQQDMTGDQLDLMYEAIDSQIEAEKYPD